MRHEKPDNPTLSVIIPASNEAGLIGQCLASVIGSTAMDEIVEIVVVSNGSIDDTAAIARKFNGQITALAGN
jgi:glycosyltransferase involved in cell wall biosynthesis